MRFLSVAERELRAAARQKGTYRIRWISAAGAFALLLWVGWAFNMFQNRSAAPYVFRAFAVLIFFYCLFVGATVTADCISREKRDGTLGLLFLTNLNSAEIVAGKLCANGLALFYSLLAFFPVLALPVLIGGITFEQFWRTVLALVNVLFFAMAAGFNASAVSVRQFTAIAQATGLALVLGTGLSGAAVVMGRLGCPRSVVDAVGMFSPLHTLLAAMTGAPSRLWSQYWPSLGTVAGVTSAWLALAAWRVGRGWRDQPKDHRVWHHFRLGERLREHGRAARTALRRRLLEMNPFFWLAGRHRVSAPVFMLLVCVLVFITAWVTAPYFGWLFRSQKGGPVLGQLFAWLWTGLAIHALVLYYAATVASQRLAEDKQVGALELVLVTPTGERSISRGLWLAYGRRMLFPVLVAVLVHCFFVWQCMTMAVIEPPGRLPPNATPGQIFWCALWDKPLKGHVLDWEFGFMLRVVLLVLAGLAANWVMLGWLGRWLGLRMKHPGFAPMAAVVLALAPPTLLFSLVCYVCDKWRFFHMPERQWLPIMMWVGFGITLANCGLWSVWAASRLRREFRTTVAGRCETPAVRDWLRWAWKVMVRFAVGTAALTLALALIVLLFYGYQNWHGQRRWAQFQKELKQRGESLDLSTSLSAPVPAAENFAQSPAFQNVLKRNSTNNPLAAALFAKSSGNTFISTAPAPANTGLTPWMNQGRSDFNLQLKWIASSKPKTIQNRKEAAEAVLSGLKPLQADLQAVVEVAQRPYFLVTTNRQAAAVLQANHPELLAMEKLHFLFQSRACALLALNRPDEAGADVLTSLRLAQLTRQSPDCKSPFRVQTMLVRSLQPIWEGLAEHRWTDAQLAAFQASLGEFDLLSDHTNAIGRVVLAYVENWRSIAEAGKNPAVVLAGTHGPRQQPAPQWQPRVWWYENCIQLFRAGQTAIARVDVAGGRVSQDYSWSDLNGLPLDSDIHGLFQQFPWSGPGPALVSFSQTAVNQGVTACALERYRLAHGDYPESLDLLQPQYLPTVPRDISRGRPMFYLRRNDGSYELRGAGANGTIDQRATPSDDWLWCLTSRTNLPPANSRKRR